MKIRHIKTFYERYYKDSTFILNAATSMIESLNGKIDDLMLFDMLPYDNIFYIEASLKYFALWYECDNGVTLQDGKQYIKNKLLNIDKENIIYAQYDDHHKQLHIMKRNHLNLVTSSNIVRYKDEFEFL